MRQRSRRTAAKSEIVIATVAFDGTLDGWRRAARRALRDGLRPEHVFWCTEGESAGLFARAADVADDEPSSLRVPRMFIALSASVSCHRDANRWSALYAALWRLSNGEPHLLDVASDPAVHRLVQMHRAVKRAAHKMKAFVRFRRVETSGADADSAFVAWFEPAHRVADRVAPFFARRFASMTWSILTPDRCVHWDRRQLSFAPGVPRASAPNGDELEDLWRTYYANIFNPSRLNGRAMRAEMPRQYWQHRPEARLIAGLTAGAALRVTTMLAQVAATPEVLPREYAAIDRDTPALQPLVDTSSWDPTYDPGAAVARRRADAALGDGPARVMIGSTPVALGVAGWTDPSLLARGAFYPDGCVTPEDRLRFYATRFAMVEVDATYYSPPTRSMAAAWAARTPDDFRFDIKAHALMTGHPADVRRLPDWIRRELPRSKTGSARIYNTDVPRPVLDELWARFRAALDPLRASGKLGAVMLQYPRWFEPTRESAALLARARELLGDDLATVEFRHRSWMTGRIAERTLALLRELRFSYVIVDAPPGHESSMPRTVAVTDERLAVFRLHGRRTATWEAKNDPVTERYRYLYDRAQLEWWAPAVGETSLEVARVHLTFNNNHSNYATTNALEMRRILEPESSQSQG
jgi:probable DNA metabolism protein